MELNCNKTVNDDSFYINYNSDNQVESYKEKDMITLLIIEAQRKEQEIQELKSELASLKEIVQNLNN